jgi:hypothetical protein
LLAAARFFYSAEASLKRQRFSNHNNDDQALTANLAPSFASTPTEHQAELIAG